MPMTMTAFEKKFAKAMNYIAFGMVFDSGTDTFRSFRYTIRNLSASFHVKGKDAFRIHRYLHAIGYRYVSKEGAILPSKLFNNESNVVVSVTLGGTCEGPCGCYYVTAE